MSGGAFEYKQHAIIDIANEIEQEINDNHKKDEWGYSNDYPPEVIAEFQKGIKALRIASIYAHRIDWLLSGDDECESFLKRLKDELESSILQGARV